MKWRKSIGWLLYVLAFAGTVALIDYALRPQSENTTPRDLYAAVQRHLALCRRADFPTAYHAAASRVQQQYSLVEYATEIQREYAPMAGTDHVEFGEVHRWQNDARKAAVDVYFVSRDGEMVGWTYVLVFEDGDWKVDHGEAIQGGQTEQRATGLQI